MAEIGTVSADEASSLTEVKVRGGNLIGFKTSTSLTSDSPQIEMIKSIAPILDKSNCEFSAADVLTYETMKFDHVAGVPKTVAVDLKLTDWVYETSCAYKLTLEPESEFVSVLETNESWNIRLNSSKY